MLKKVNARRKLTILHSKIPHRNNMLYVIEIHAELNPLYTHKSDQKLKKVNYSSNSPMVSHITKKKHHKNDNLMPHHTRPVGTEQQNHKECQISQ